VDAAARASVATGDTAGATAAAGATAIAGAATAAEATPAAKAAGTARARTTRRAAMKCRDFAAATHGHHQDYGVHGKSSQCDVITSSVMKQLLCGCDLGRDELVRFLFNRDHDAKTLAQL